MRQWFARNWRWLLAISLALNLLAAGILFAGYWHRRSIMAEAPFYMQNGMMSPMMHRQMMDMHQRMRLWWGRVQPPAEVDSAVRRLRQARRDVAAALAAEPFDKKALEEAFSRLRAASAAAQKEIHDRIVERAQKLDKEERLQLLPRRIR